MMHSSGDFGQRSVFVRIMALPKKKRKPPHLNEWNIVQGMNKKRRGVCVCVTLVMNKSLIVLPIAFLMRHFFFLPAPLVLPLYIPYGNTHAMHTHHHYIFKLHQTINTEWKR